MADVRREAVDEPAQLQRAQEPADLVIADPGRKRPAQRGTGRAGHVHVVARGGLAVGEIHAIAFGTGETGGEQNVQDQHGVGREQCVVARATFTDYPFPWDFAARPGHIRV